MVSEHFEWHFEREKRSLKYCPLGVTVSELSTRRCDEKRLVKQLTGGESLNGVDVPPRKGERLPWAILMYQINGRKCLTVV